MDLNEIRRHLSTALVACLAGGREIMEVYAGDFDVELKADDSPLTIADKRANHAIEALLLESGMPILSEEGRSISFEERKDWPVLWIVDPLDGTKEFVKRNGEFTVNVALVESGQPILGVIYVPDQDIMYFGAKDLGAFKCVNYNETVTDVATDDLLTEVIERSEPIPVKSDDRNLTVVGSRSHMSEETAEFIAKLEKEQGGKVDILSVGSSLKLCMVAEGKANLYPRFAPTMEWDTAAGQAIVESAGGSVLDWSTRETMMYNKEDLLNQWFLVKGADS